MACSYREFHWIGSVLFVSMLGCSEGAPDPLAYPSGADAVVTEAVATLVRVSGDVRVAPAGTGQWVAGAAERSLRPADAVQTMEHATATVRFADSDVVTELAPGTTLRIPEQAPRVARLRHLAGQLTARISPSQHAERLEVALPSGQLILEQDGTDEDGFAEARVTIEDDVSEVAMLRGRGRLDRTSGDPITIEEAHYARVHTDEELVEQGLDVVFPVGGEHPPADSERVTQGTVRFRWASMDGATGYELQIRDAAGDVREVSAESSSARVPLPAGSFTWTVRSRFGDDIGHPRPALSFTHRVDRSAPELSIERPTPNQSTRSRTVLVAGRTEPLSSVRVNGVSISVGRNGGFRTAVPVQVGLTNLVVETRDAVGNRRAVTRSVLRSR
ncbi:MAG: hypothetical protein AB8I08_02390 [Sandaracinaceae bacterium]